MRPAADRTADAALKVTSSGARTRGQVDHGFAGFAIGVCVGVFLKMTPGGPFTAA